MYTASFGLKRHTHKKIMTRRRFFYDLLKLGLFQLAKYILFQLIYLPTDVSVLKLLGTGTGSLNTVQYAIEIHKLFCGRCLIILIIKFEKQ